MTVKITLKQLKSDNILLIARIEELEAKLAKAVECLGPCITLLDGLVEYSKREIEWDEEDTFRMGEWFESGDLERIESARATLAELSSVSCANLKGETDE